MAIVPISKQSWLIGNKLYLGNVERCGASVSKQCTAALNCYV